MTIGELKQWLKSNDVTDNFQLAITDDSGFFYTDIQAELFPNDTVAITLQEGNNA